MYHLSTTLGINPIKKKLQKTLPHVALPVKAKLEKILKAEFRRAIDYAECISNIVQLSKHEKSIQVCTNSKDLNKACPKDDFLFLNINMIVEMAVGYEMY